MILYNNWPVTFGKFPNGESNLKKIKIDPQDLNHIVTLKYESDEDLFHLLLVRKALDVPVSLRILYTPYSRMDRDSDVYTFSLKVFAEFINSMNWEKVIIFEPHSDVLPALLDRVEVVDVTTSLIMRVAINEAFYQEPYQICFPDVGAFKRYSEKLKTPDPLVGFKVRDFETGKITSLSIKGYNRISNVVIVDDLCSKGGTFILAAESLKRMGFKKIVLAVAHCENTVFSGSIFLEESPIDKVITTDSILDKQVHPKLKIIPISEFRY